MVVAEVDGGGERLDSGSGRTGIYVQRRYRCAWRDVCAVHPRASDDIADLCQVRVSRPIDVNIRCLLAVAEWHVLHIVPLDLRASFFRWQIIMYRGAR